MNPDRILVDYVGRANAQLITEYPIGFMDVLTAAGVVERIEDPETYERTYRVVTK